MNNPAKTVSTIHLGELTIPYEMESKRSLDLEIFILNILQYVVIFVFSLGYIPFALFLPLFYVVAIRAFMANHDRMHTNHAIRSPRIFEIITEWFDVTVTPWDEPYESIKKKHMAHHVAHGHDKKIELNTKKDPHGVFDIGLLRSLFSSLFFEEVQLFLDIRGNTLAKSRLYRFLIYVPLMALFISYFGWQTFFLVLLAVRVTKFTGWFVFSWVFHQPALYYFGFSHKVAEWLARINSILFGRRIALGTFSHAVHHAWPGVPYSEFKRIDKIVSENVLEAPRLFPN